MSNIKIAYTPEGDSGIGSASHKLQCSLCGESDRDKLIVEDILLGGI